MLLVIAPCLILSVLLIRDLTSRTLPNLLVTTYALLFLPYFFLHGGGWVDLAGHLLVGFAAFVVLFGLFLINAMGGGDVKLGAAVFMWAGPSLALPVLIIVGLTGGVLGVLGWLADCRFWQRPAQRFRALNAVLYALSAKRGVPYGVALVAGALFVVWRGSF